MTAIIISYGLAATGLLLTVVVVLQLQLRRVTIAAANRVLIGQLRDKQIESARKVCSAVPGTYLDAVRDAIVALPIAKDRVSVEGAVYGAFEPVAKQLDRKWRARNERGFLGTALVAGGLTLQLSGGAAPTALWILGGAGALGIAWLLALRDYMANALASARREVLPALVEAAAG